MAELINKIPRGLRVLLAVAILAALIWKMVPISYLFIGVGTGIIITGLVIYFTYRTTPSKRMEKAGSAIEVNQPEASAETSQITHEPGETTLRDSGTIMDFLKTNPAEPALEIRDPAAKGQPSSEVEKPREASVQNETMDKEKLPEEAPAPMTSNKSSLSEDDKRKLMNAVWYRCENPYCKYTQFLDVHHIVTEKDGGTNRLDNLIVLCPYCQALADKHEIPLEEMQDWINREDRFKVKPEWPYYK